MFISILMLLDFNPLQHMNQISLCLLSSAKNVASITDHDQSKLDKKNCGYLIFTRPIFSNEGISEQVDSKNGRKQCWIQNLFFRGIPRCNLHSMHLPKSLRYRPKLRISESFVSFSDQIRILMKFDGIFLLLSDATRPFTAIFLFKLKFVYVFA